MYIYMNREHAVVVICQVLSAQCFFFKLNRSQSDYGHKKTMGVVLGLVMTFMCSVRFSESLMLPLLLKNERKLKKRPKDATNKVP